MSDILNIKRDFRRSRHVAKTPDSSGPGSPPIESQNKVKNELKLEKSEQKSIGNERRPRGRSRKPAGNGQKDSGNERKDASVGQKDFGSRRKDSNPEKAVQNLQRTSVYHSDSNTANSAADNAKSNAGNRSAGNNDSRGRGRGRDGQRGNQQRGDNRNGSTPINLPKELKSGLLRLVPLGGLHEIGKNMTALEYGDSILIIDCGMSFPEDEMYGIDIVIPDYTYLEKNSHKVKGMILTHGHEDHIGGIPYLLKRLSMPIYGTRLTLGLVKSKLDEHGIRGNLKSINAGQKLKIGPFNIEAIRVTHSIADSLCFAIDTPVGRIFHTGDFKIDYTPVDGDPMSFQKLAEIGSGGVLLMLSDSTNALREGYTKSERELEGVMDSIFKDSESRIIIATFASNVHRIQTIINTAVKYKRKVTLSGRSMLKVLDLAIELGYIHIPQNVLVDINEIKNIPDKKLVIITTGSQGEPMSALTRMANHDHRAVSIRKGDKIILSSSPIPGNENAVSGIVNKLLEIGAEVIYSDIADIHVSGHACREELKLMLRLIKPQFFMPVHGEYKHLHQHMLLAQELGMPKEQIIVTENGAVLEISKNKVKLTNDKVPADPVFVDGLGVGDIGAIVLHDRKLLSESGLIIVSAAIDTATGRIVSGPEIFTRGFVYVRENEKVIEDLRTVAAKKLYELEKSGKCDLSTTKNAVRDELKNHIFLKTKRTPVIVTVFLEA